MTAFFVFWGIVLIIGVLAIMSSSDKASDKEKEQKKRNAKIFVLVILGLIFLASIVFFDTCKSSIYDDPSEWARRP